jgi:uncharacterized protein YdbL (DUF1318 family)
MLTIRLILILVLIVLTLLAVVVAVVAAAKQWGQVGQHLSCALVWVLPCRDPAELLRNFGS